MSSSCIGSTQWLREVRCWCGEVAPIYFGMIDALLANEVWFLTVPDAPIFSYLIVWHIVRKYSPHPLSQKHFSPQLPCSVVFVFVICFAHAKMQKSRSMLSSSVNPTLTANVGRIFFAMIANGKEWRASIGYITNVDTVALTIRESLRPIMIILLYLELVRITNLWPLQDPIPSCCKYCIDIWFRLPP
nr:uncharacterized protein LOC109166676 [Ipomoea trifida]